MQRARRGTRPGILRDACSATVSPSTPSAASSLAPCAGRDHHAAGERACRIDPSRSRHRRADSRRHRHRALHGRGFEARVGPGAIVRAGDELIRFDLEIGGAGAKSLMTPIVVTPMDGLRLARCRAMGPVSAGELLFEVTGITAPLIAAAGAAPADRRRSRCGADGRHKPSW